MRARSMGELSKVCRRGPIPVEGTVMLQQGEELSLSYGFSQAMVSAG